MNLNSHFPMHHGNDHEMQYDHIDDHHHIPFVPNLSSSSLSCHFFFNSTQDHTTSFYDHYQTPTTTHHIADEKYVYRGGSSYEMKSKVDGGLKLTLWKKENDEEEEVEVQSHNPMKWMSSKMRVMQKMKKTDHHDHRVVLSVKTTTMDQKVQPSSSSAETDLSSNSSSYNYNNNSPIRVCSDCNTTKTPLWRSGPNGPKSLCNACGIRQRKARRAMAAAASAAAANGAVANSSDQNYSSMKIKLQQKGKTGKNGHVATQLKKRCKTTTATAAGGLAPEGKKQIGFEEFLINLSNNLAVHRVFPDDEKDAAFLLMALSSGLVNA